MRNRPEFHGIGQSQIIKVENCKNEKNPHFRPSMQFVHLDDFAFEIAVKTEKKLWPCLQNFNSGVPARHRLRL